MKRIFVPALSALLFVGGAGTPDTNGAGEIVTYAAKKTSTQDPAAQVPRITAEELKALVARGEAVVVDVRGTEAYLTGHVKGALSMPGDEVTSRASELPRDKMIVTYCT